MKTKLLIAALAATAIAAPAQAKVSFSGQVSNVIGLGGDFDESLNITQNGASGTRFRFKADKEIGAGITAALRLEIQDSKDIAGANADEDLRYSDISFSGGFGKISFGQGDGAANGVSEDYTAVTGNYFAGVHGVDFAFGSLGGDGSFNSLDFLSRNQRVRYDSPKFGGLQISASARSEDGSEIAARYKGEFAGTTIHAQIATTELNDADLTGGSFGIILPMGLNLSASVVDGDGEIESTTVALGYRSGKWRASVESGEYTNAAGVESTLDTIGFTYAGPVTLYAAYGSAETAGVEFDAPIIGARMKF